MKLFLIFVAFQIVIAGCHLKKIKSMDISAETRVEGYLYNDSVFDGLIKFYDIRSNRLIEEADYKLGAKDGIDILYHDNGRQALKAVYSDGKRNGNVVTFDTSGDITSSEFYYFDIRTGNNIEYFQNKPKYYWFCSLDYENIFHLDYDSIKGKRVSDLGSQYLFYYKHEYTVLTKNDSVEKKIRYFLYTFDPPKFNFKYKLVLIDSQYKVLSVLKEFDNSKPWSEFDYEPGFEKIGSKQAIELRVIDSINNSKVTMYKILNKSGQD